jgi:hypothetical protein
MDILSKNFHVMIPNDDSVLPLLFWTPKLHKTFKSPYKSRFIAGASKSTTTLLSKHATLCLKLIRTHFSRYCRKISLHTGINCFWSIDNSLEFIDKIKKIDASSLHTFDFSTLYTNLPQPHRARFLKLCVVSLSKCF